MADQGNEGLLSPFLRKKRIAEVLNILTMPEKDTLSVLDYGCGSGAMSSFFNKNQYTGIDIDRESLEIAKNLHRKYLFLYPNELDPENKFDIIIAMAVIEHFSSPLECLNNLKSKLKYPSGLIIITTPKPWGEYIHGIGARLGLFSRHGHDEHKSMLNKDALLNIAEKSGLKVKKYKTFLFGINQLIVLSF